MQASLPANEVERLATLRSYGLLDTPAEAAFDDIAYLAAHICQTPISLVSLVDANRQWFKARHGLGVSETHRDFSFCAHAILQPGELLLVPDAPQDRRFADNQLVTGAPHIRFYAGMPLTTPEGHALGSLCVIDRQPRLLSAAQLDALRMLARQVGALLEMRRQKQLLADAESSTAARNAELSRANFLLHTEIEERKRVEGALGAREEQLRDLFENATDLIQSVAPDGRLLFVNRAWLNTLGYRAAELSALTVFDIIHPDSLSECLEKFGRVMQGEPLHNFQAIFRAKDGRSVYVEGNASCRFEHGKPVATRAIFRDITQRKAVEAERERLIAELQAALAEVKTLGGLLPICGWCKKIRDDTGYWNSVEGYLKQHVEVEFTHGICPECTTKMMADLAKVPGLRPPAP